MERDGAEGNRKSREEFLRVLLAGVERCKMSSEERVLIVGGSEDDGEVLRRAGFHHIDSSSFFTGGSGQEPEENQGNWGIHLDAEDMNLANESYDLVFAHEVLHHCRSPHRALCEMLRVARKQVLLLEPNDSLVMRVLTRMGFSFPYELTAVAYHQSISGGVRDSAVPNFIYRWNRREVTKTASAFMPERDLRIDAYPYWDFNTTELDLELKKETRIGSITSVVGTRNFLAFLRRIQSSLNLTPLIRSQGNKFFCCIERLPDLKPWLEIEDGRIVFRSLNEAGRGVMPRRKAGR